MRIVLDTNILVSGIINKNTPPGQLLESVKNKTLTLIISLAQLEELQRVLNYPRLQRLIVKENSDALLDTINSVAEIIETIPIVEISPDPDDNFIIAAAITSNADLIVSGDKRHMISLHSVEGIPILTARNAIEYIRINQ